LPVKEAEISIEMKKHAFGWGTAIDANTFQTNPTYKTNFYKNFNKAVFENDLKWPEWNNMYTRSKAISVLDELNEAKIDVRGHCLVWPSWQWLPGDLKQYEKEPEVLKEKVRNHIQDETETLGSKIKEWDVFNEPYTNTDLQRICGEEVMRDWFVETKKYNKTATLYINDFSILSGGGMDKAHQDHYYSTIKYIKEANTPLEGIGFQGHFGWWLTSPETVWKIIDRFSEFGVPMQVTEFDIDIDDEQLQADYTRDFMTTIFAHPKMNGFMVWGFWANRHWKPNGAMYRADWTEKPNLGVWNELIYKKWWTNATGKTDDTGRYQVRGFHGLYTFTLKDNKGNIIGTGDFTLDGKGKVFTLNYK
jgi:endo-1,4-beta-xylanase